MRKSPGRRRLRELTRAQTKKKGDLGRKSTHKMRSNMYMKEKA